MSIILMIIMMVLFVNVLSLMFRIGFRILGIVLGILLFPVTIFFGMFPFLPVLLIGGLVFAMFRGIATR